MKKITLPEQFKIQTSNSKRQNQHTNTQLQNRNQNIFYFCHVSYASLFDGDTCKTFVHVLKKILKNNEWHIQIIYFTFFLMLE